MKAQTLMKAPENGVMVRMYRQGLGDCFLLAFPAARQRPFYLLIDCGVLLGTASAKDKIREVAEHIKAATDGKIDVLVATHQHWDHLSGFFDAADIFQSIEFGEVWLGWTDDPNDPTARRLAQGKKAALGALRAAQAKLASVSGETDQSRSRGGIAEDLSWLSSVLDFHGPAPVTSLGAKTGSKETPSNIQQALSFVQEELVDQPRYCRPSDPPFCPDGLSGVRFYVLGPPLDVRMLTRSNPTKTFGDVFETEKGPALNEASSFYLAASTLTLGPEDADGSASESCGFADEELELSRPFEQDQSIPWSIAEQVEFFERHYFSEAQSWRRVDDDWLGAAGQLGLQLDSDTNNTSLALAIEFTASGRVVLFPGDAQVGSWHSWSTLSWTVKDAHGKDTTVTGTDLLKRVVFYKVGHHASHNATLNTKGLALMGDRDLVQGELTAMIPVDETMARKPKGGSPDGWDMPFKPLLDALIEHTRGRVIRLDQGLPSQPKGLSKKEWNAFLDKCLVEKLFIEYSVQG